MAFIKALISQEFQFSGYFIVPYREEDIFLIKKWRNEQMDVLRQNRVLTDNDQVNYYNGRVIPSFNEDKPTIMLFSILDDKRSCIGYGGLTNIVWHDHRAEISFLVNTERTKDAIVYENDFLSFLELMKIVAFEELKFNRLFTETYDIRPLHISILEKSGFVLEGRMKEHVCINGNFADSLIHGYLKSYYELKK